MIHSKPVKSSYLSDKEPTTRIGKILKKLDYLFKIHVYYPVIQPFRTFSERFKRSLAYAKFGWMHFDFDHAYIWDLMAFKLRRIRSVLVDGHLHQDQEDVKALSEAIQICDRLHEQKYEDKYYREHDKKWGKLRHRDIPERDENGKIKHYRWDMYRTKVKTPSQKKKERIEFLKCSELAELDRRADLDRLNVILKEHEQKWWD